MCEVEEITVGYSVKYKRKSRNPNETRAPRSTKKRERSGTAELGFKKPLTKEEKIEKKKQRLAAIGEDLLAIAADQPFRFPATFTFVVRAFSVLDGIGKGLDPRFDITEIAKPYALELLRFREAGVEDFRKRWDRQSQAFYNLFRQADRVEKLAQTIQRLEQGDLKLRVGALESERAFQRVAAVQNTIGSGNASMEIVRGVRHLQSIASFRHFADVHILLYPTKVIYLCFLINLFCVATAHPRRYFLIGIFATEAAGLRTGAILRTDLLML
ncbi:UNVERIFIED_CONTAM: protein ACTIVITY OF BC1 COMPLEX kinase, chloroplastic [Sesamum calycinum]|uniref:Protein ACTIVITY OF BC1 COMPLEX kinase, chloroplastic n=1 Tax=Sesamum calycinum TaxID=2727403 RepID=A0AAW2K088_9LAMI